MTTYFVLQLALNYKAISRLSPDPVSKSQTVLKKIRGVCFGEEAAGVKWGGEVPHI